MSLTLVLGGELGERLLRDAERDQVPPSEHAKLLLSLASAIRGAQPQGAFAKAVRDYLSRRTLDADLVSSAFDELMILFTKNGCDPASIDADYDVIATELPPIETLVQRMGRMRRTTARGKYSQVGANADEFASEKRREIALEEGGPS